MKHYYYRGCVGPPAMMVFLLLGFWPALSGAEQAQTSCMDRVKELKEWCRALQDINDQAGCAISPLKELELVKIDPKPGATAPECGSLVVLFRDKLLQDGAPIEAESADAAMRALEDRLESQRRNFAIVAPQRPFPGLVNLAVDQGTPWSRVVEISRVVKQAGYHRLALVFAPAEDLEVSAPALSSIDGEIEEIYRLDIAEKVSRLAGLWERLLAPCPELALVITRLAGVDPADRQKLLLAELPGAVEKCRCAVDITALRQLLWVVFFVPPTLVVTLDLDGPGRKAQVRARGNQPWRKSHRVLLDAARRKPKRPVLMLAE